MDLPFVLRSLKGRCQVNQFLVYPTFIRRIGIPKRIRISQCNGSINSR